MKQEHRMKKILVVVSLSALSLTAFALTKEEREFLKASVTPALAEANAKFHGACGCPTPITIDEGTITSMDDVHNFKYMADDVAENAPKYCTDAASKKAMCQLKSLTFSHTKEAFFKITAGKGQLTTDGQSHATWEMMTRELDK
jgi:hypothetical protein